jgi:MFS family permease
MWLGSLRIPPRERAAANGLTGTARQLGLVLAPLVVGPIFSKFERASLIFWISGGLKIVYDLWLWRTFRHLKPPEEQVADREGVTSR